MHVRHLALPNSLMNNKPRPCALRLLQECELGSQAKYLVRNTRQNCATYQRLTLIERRIPMHRMTPGTALIMRTMILMLRHHTNAHIVELDSCDVGTNTCVS